MSAVTQATRGIGGGAAYVERLLAAGRTRTEALRLLRRRLSHVVLHAPLAAERRRVTPTAGRPATAARHGTACCESGA